MIYELINPSDKITFEADDDNVAKAAGLIVGHGKFGVSKYKEDNTEDTILDIYMQFPDEHEQTKLFGGLTLNEFIVDNKQNIIDCCQTLAVCNIEDRDNYRELSKNYSDIDFMKKWDEENCTSISNICAVAHSIRKSKDGE